MKTQKNDIPVCLIIMDGYGIDREWEGNAITLAQTPRIDAILRDNPHRLLEASGTAVGLPEGQMGNSEVGHLNIGAGRVVFQELSRINNACADGSLARNEVLRAAYDNTRKDGAVLHLMGLVSNGGVHSSIAHIYALLQLAADMEVPEVRIHCFMDGRDVPPTSGKDFIRDMQEHIDAIATPACHIAIGSIHGRYFAMDRDNRWERIAVSYDCLVDGQAYTELSPLDFMQASYDAGVNDEFIVPGCFEDRGICDGDSVVFYNFRPDRAREISRAITEGEFESFERSRTPQVNFVCLTEYDPTIKAPIAFAKEFPEHVLADVIADAGLRQLHIAETEKYAHVTFFLNGGREAEKQKETRILVPSPKVATYDLQPEMSAPEVTQKLVESIANNEADFYVVNFANCDMVGHTGIIPAAIAAVEAVDAGVGAVVDAITGAGGVCLLTADHGNADKMRAEDGSPHTAHTTAPVPFAIIDGAGIAPKLRQDDAALCDIAPTILQIMGLEQPIEMSGKSLLA